jgi:long-chain acyl-CoA synthetase
MVAVPETTPMTGADGRPLAPLPAGSHLLVPLLEWAERDPDRPLAGSRHGEEIGWVTAADFAERVRQLAKGLIASGIGRGDRVALLSRTRLEWPMIDLAVMMAGGVTVPIYETSSLEQVRWILSDSGARLAVVETAALAQRVEDAAPASDACYGPLVIDAGAVEELARRGDGVTDAVVDERLAGLGPQSLATIVYTSGTTGRPKGCMLTHGNLLGNVHQVIAAARHMFGPEETSLLFLPLAHALSRMIWLFGLTFGFRTVFAGDLKLLPKELAVARPTVMVAVPRVFEKAYSSARHTAQSDGHGAMFDRAADVAVRWSQARAGHHHRPVTDLERAVFDRLVYRRIRAAFGGRLRIAVSGGGPLGDWLTHFFTGVGVDVYEGYGLTESSPVITLNVAGAWKPGTVGRPLPATDVRIAPDGEIVARGRQIFAGYWQAEAPTAEMLGDDGWLCTGDLGALDADGFLRITGRKKDLIVTSGGKNVSPAPLEERLRDHPLVSEAVVLGDRRPYVVALLTLDSEAVPDWCEKHGRPVPDPAALAGDEELVAALQEAVDAANASVSQAEAIRRFAILPRELTVEADELTPTLKVRRAVVEREYADVIQALYRRRSS